MKWKVELRIGKAPSIVYSLESEDSETHVSSVNTGEREKHRYHGFRLLDQAVSGEEEQW